MHRITDVRIKKTKANKKTVKDFCDRTVELNSRLVNFRKRLEEKINNSEQDLEEEVRASMERSEDLKERIEQLAK